MREDDELDDADVIDESESDGYINDMQDGSDLDRPEDYNRAVDDASSYMKDLNGRLK